MQRNTLSYFANAVLCIGSARYFARVVVGACLFLLLAGAPSWAAPAPPEAGARIRDGFKLFVVGDLIEAIPIANTINDLSPSLVRPPQIN